MRSEDLAWRQNWKDGPVGEAVDLCHGEAVVARVRRDSTRGSLWQWYWRGGNPEVDSRGFVERAWYLDMNDAMTAARAYVEREAARSRGLAEELRWVNPDRGTGLLHRRWYLKQGSRTLAEVLFDEKANTMGQWYWRTWIDPHADSRMVRKFYESAYSARMEVEKLVREKVDSEFKWEESDVVNGQPRGWNLMRGEKVMAIVRCGNTSDVFPWRWLSVNTRANKVGYQSAKNAMLAAEEAVKEEIVEAKKEETAEKNPAPLTEAVEVLVEILRLLAPMHENPRQRVLAAIMAFYPTGGLDRAGSE